MHVWSNNTQMSVFGIFANARLIKQHSNVCYRNLCLCTFDQTTLKCLFSESLLMHVWSNNTQMSVFGIFANARLIKQHSNVCYRNLCLCTFDQTTLKCLFSESLLMHVWSNNSQMSVFGILAYARFIKHSNVCFRNLCLCKFDQTTLKCRFSESLLMQVWSNNTQMSVFGIFAYARWIKQHAYLQQFSTLKMQLKFFSSV
jgi:hypothetical protein